ncbi:MAG: bifunctional diaminohydroxyphosphoribosylaminopyrimidine deaminase/5-amino-6-(5-phosphoribosylamino)uracil reductase RibD [bacterium]|nr:bifunctional diaminohydroxyphosphoribosylaminopyrimidine deaminase/5-amino-6-(5-phosphoribosylamino)uracil reductase RibD [bacterium]
MNSDEFWMSRALKVALKGFGKVGPNPMVGAIIVKDGKLLSSGAHVKFGGPHAEINALKKIQFQAKGASLYVTLEPCNHYGKTPPCTNAIIQSGISRVVSATMDPNPIVSGRGYARLRNAGIEVIDGILCEKAVELNTAYFKHLLSGLPYTILKIAQSLDGKIATSTGQSQWITGELSRRFVHQVRSEVDAVIVGIGTVLQDDPLLNVRLVKGQNPIRIILDSRFRTPPTAKLFQIPSPIIVMGIAGEGVDRQLKLKQAGAEVIELPKADEHLSLFDALRVLPRRGINRILVEGGRKIATEFLKKKLVDELIVAIAPKIIGEDGISSFSSLGITHVDEAIHFKHLHIERFGNDIHLRLQVQ